MAQSLSLATALLYLLALLETACALEVDLLWNTEPAAITTALSLVRFANDTAPPSTEWIGVGWEYGSLGLEHRADRSGAVVLQLTPPSAAHRAEVGRAGSSASATHRDTRMAGFQQTVLELAVELDSSVPYYFKVEAHHDLRQNRTTYEGLYSTGSQWDYVGALVLQHPRDPLADDALTSAIGAAIHASAKAQAKSNATSKASDSDSESEDEGSDNEEEESPGAKHTPSGLSRLSRLSRLPRQLRRAAADSPSRHAAIPPFPDPPLFPHVFSGIRCTSNQTSSDSAALRAGIFKRMALRDRLGQSFAVTNPRAVLYDADDSTASSSAVRHYLASSSFLIALSGPSR
ncbi:hypothetical protein H4S06_001711 [Coemansia sp. BCRC 34490]|nr:hypothetical protein H4S06_001711 [Coemansia sp. BCRC 34490]